MLDEQKQRAKKTPIYQNIYEVLQQRVRGGEWLPGERLPSIVQLAKEMEAGTGSVREALRSLESIGLVKIEHGSGVYVTGLRPVTEISGHFSNLGDDLLLAHMGLGDVLDPHPVPHRQRLGCLADAIAQRLAEAGIVEDPDVPPLEKAGHPASMTDLRQRAGDDDPVIAGQHAHKLIRIPLGEKLRHCDPHSDPRLLTMLSCLVPARPA